MGNLDGLADARLCELLKIEKLKTSFYPLQADGLGEHFNKTLKEMLRKFVTTDPKHWD